MAATRPPMTSTWRTSAAWRGSRDLSVRTSDSRAGGTGDTRRRQAWPCAVSSFDASVHSLEFGGWLNDRVVGRFHCIALRCIAAARFVALHCNVAVALQGMPPPPQCNETQPPGEPATVGWEESRV